MANIDPLTHLLTLHKTNEVVTLDPQGNQLPPEKIEPDSKESNVFNLVSSTLSASKYIKIHRDSTTGRISLYLDSSLKKIRDFKGTSPLPLPANTVNIFKELTSSGDLVFRSILAKNGLIAEINPTTGNVEIGIDTDYNNALDLRYYVRNEDINITKDWAGLDLRGNKSDGTGYGYVDFTAGNRQVDMDWRLFSHPNGVDFYMHYGNPANTGGHGQLGAGSKFVFNANGHIWSQGYGWFHDRFLEKTVNGDIKSWWYGNGYAFKGDIVIQGNTAASAWGTIYFQRNGGADGNDFLIHNHPTNDHFYFWKRGRGVVADSTPLIFRPSGTIYLGNPAVNDDEIPNLLQVKTLGGGKNIGEICYFPRVDTQFVDEKNTTWLLLNGQSTPANSKSRQGFGDNLPDYSVSSSSKVTTFMSGLNGPTDICTNANGDLYILSFNEGSVKKYTSGGAYISTLATGIAAGCRGMCYDPITNACYVASYNAWDIFKVPDNGSGAVACNASARDATDCEVDRFGNIYVTCWGGYEIRKYVPSTGVTTVFASGMSAYMIALDKNDYLWWTDLSGNLYKKHINGSGQVTVLTGIDVSSLDYCLATHKLYQLFGQTLKEIDPDTGSIVTYATLSGINGNWKGMQFKNKTVFVCAYDSGVVWKVGDPSAINPYTQR
jgi:hypothetical protein